MLKSRFQSKIQVLLFVPAALWIRLWPWPRSLNRTALVISLFLFQGLSSSLALGRRYRAHATASHAQNCPDRELERPIFPWSSCINLFYFRKCHSLALVGRYSVHATALYAQDCPDWRLEKAPPFVCNNCKNISFRNVPFSGFGQALSRSCYGITRTRLS